MFILFSVHFEHQHKFLKMQRLTLVYLKIHNSSIIVAKLIIVAKIDTAYQH